MRLFSVWICLLAICTLSACGGDTVSPAPVLEGQTWRLLDHSHGGDGSAWGLPECSQCHVYSRLHSQRPDLRPLATQHGEAGCRGCHGDNGSGMPRACTTCHNPQTRPHSPVRDGANAHDFGQLQASTGDTDAQCVTCHQAANMDGQFDRQTDLTRWPDAHGELSPYLNDADFCLRCHNDQPPSGITFDPDLSPTLTRINDAYQLLDKHGVAAGSGERTYSGLREGYHYNSQVACTDCHSMHGTHNEKLLIGSAQAGVSQLAHPLRTQNPSVSIVGSDYSQLCVLCHQMQIPLEQALQDTGNGWAGVHATGSDCIDCHRHGHGNQVGL